MMKKFILALFALASMIFMVACAADQQDSAPPEDTTNESQQPVEQSTYELALITDSGTIDDNAYNQKAWEGMKKYADENEISYTYYQPIEASDTAYLNSIAEAVANGAKLIVCPGYLFDSAVYTAQYQYPDTMFIILDGEPHTADYKTYTIEDNVYSIYFAEQEAGFLAGYAAVKNGFTKLGFIGGMALPAMTRFGYGYVYGAEYAAQEMEITGIEISYHYTGGAMATSDIQTLASLWYNAGTEIIFCCDPIASEGVFAAAEPLGAYVIGVDIDQSSESNTVVISAVKNLTAATYSAIESYYNDEFPAGEIVRLQVANDGVALTMESSKLNSFTQEDYNSIYNRLASGEITVPVDTDYTSAAEMSNSAVTVTVVQ